MELFILILIIVPAIFLVFYKKKIKGIIGEKTVSSILYFLNSTKYNVINNVVIKNGEVTSQIDHAIVSDFGIFVIETKNFKGWIVGGEKSEFWTQVIFKYKNRFYNPLLQNSGHIKALKECLVDYPHIKYYSIIVFSNNAEIKVNTSEDVINSSQLLRTIKKYSEVNLTEAEKERITQKINLSNVSESYNKGQHIKSIKRRINHREKSIAQNKCPRCGSDLIKRKGKFGFFLGCKTYPKCRFIRNI